MDKSRCNHNFFEVLNIQIFFKKIFFSKYGRLLLLAVVPAGHDPLCPLGGLDDGEGPLRGEVEDQHANGDPL